MSALRKVLNQDGSQIRGLGILASMNVPISDEKEAFPYKVIAYVFAHQEPNSLSTQAYNFGWTLRRLRNIDGIQSESPLDRRFDQLVKSGDAKRLFQNIKRLLPLVKDIPINYTRLYFDIKSWSNSDNKTRNQWIEGYYTGSSVL